MKRTKPRNSPFSDELGYVTSPREQQMVWNQEQIINDKQCTYNPQNQIQYSELSPRIVFVNTYLHVG